MNCTLKKAQSRHASFRKPDISEDGASEGLVVERPGVVRNIRNGLTRLDRSKQLLLRCNRGDNSVQFEEIDEHVERLKVAVGFVKLVRTSISP